MEERKQAMRTLLPLLSVIFLSACSQAEPAPSISVDVPAIIGSDTEAVEGFLGAASCADDSGGQSCEFNAPFTSVFFFGGVAANVTLPFVDDLRVYGLDIGEPETVTGNREEWQTSIKGQSATVYRFPNYVYIKTHDT